MATDLKRSNENRKNGTAEPTWETRFFPAQGDRSSEDAALRRTDAWRHSDGFRIPPMPTIFHQR